MATWNDSLPLRIALGVGLLLSGSGAAFSLLAAQTPAPAAAAVAPKLGTVKAISGSTITVATDAGATVRITVPETAKVQKLAEDKKTTTSSQFSDIAIGDRVLAAVKQGDTPDSFTARQVVLMKSGDVAQIQAAEQADWKTRGTGGIVSAVDPATGTITITSGTKKTIVDTSSNTAFRRFAGDSVKYEDAKPGTLAQIQPKDQLQARGAKSADGTTIQAEEVISGSFEDLSGLLISVDAAGGKITLKDLATKKVMTVEVTANSSIRNMPAQMAASFAARTNGGGAGRRGGAGVAGGGAGGPITADSQGGPSAPAGGAGGGAARRSMGADLSQMITRMPAIKVADLKKGDAVMIVASEPTPGASTVTAITVLSGVDPILTANPNGGMDLSMSMGGGGGGE